LAADSFATKAQQGKRSCWTITRKAERGKRGKFVWPTRPANLFKLAPTQRKSGWGWMVGGGAAEGPENPLARHKNS